MTTVQVVNSGRCHTPLMNEILRDIAYTTAINNCAIRVQHISTKANRLADLLSRFNLNPDYKWQFLAATPEHWEQVTVDESLFKIINKW